MNSQNGRDNWIIFRHDEAQDLEKPAGRLRNDVILSETRWAALTAVECRYAGDIVKQEHAKHMKKFTIEVSHASPAQLATIALDLKIMSNGWEKHGPRIMINGQQVKAPSLRIQGSSSKPQASSRKRHKLAMFI